jgi:hypothetical protein
MEPVPAVVVFAPSPGAVTRLGRSLGFAAAFMLQWEAWVLGLAPLALKAVVWLLESSGLGRGAIVDLPFLGPVSPWYLIGTAVAGLLLGAEIVLLVPLVERRRGLDLGFLRRNRPAALLAAGGIVGGRFAAAFTEYYLAMRPGGMPSGTAMRLALLGLPQLAVVFSAWIAFGHIEGHAGRRPPGLASFAGAGCVVLLAGLIGPETLLDWILVPSGPRRYADPGTAVSLAYALSVARDLLIVFSLAWFLRFLVTGREERTGAAA